MRRTLVFTLLAAALSITACTETGSPSPAAVVSASSAGTSSAGTSSAGTSSTGARHVDPNHVTSADALGDITTVSPCSLIDRKALAAYGATELVPADDLDDCAVRFGGGVTMAVVGTLEDLTKLTLKGTTLPRPGGMHIVRAQNGPTRCDAILVFADNVGMTSFATSTRAKGAVVCEIATKLLDQVIATVTGAGPRHRDYPAYSLSGRKACDLLTGAEVKLAGVGALHQLGSFPAHHRCLYGVSRGTATASVELDFGERGPGWDPQWTEVQVGGSNSLVMPDPHPGTGKLTYCVVSMAWLMIDEPDPKAMSETAALTVRVPSGQPVPCAQAKKVAAAVWEKIA